MDWRCSRLYWNSIFAAQIIPTASVLACAIRARDQQDRVVIAIQKYTAGSMRPRFASMRTSCVYRSISRKSEDRNEHCRTKVFPSATAPLNKVKERKCLAGSQPLIKITSGLSPIPTCWAGNWRFPEPSLLITLLQGKTKFIMQ